jgi:hypothetical protein
LEGNLPERIKNFMWLIAQHAILTKDNMIRRQWQGDSGCYFCGVHEDMDHLFFKCPVAKVVWGVLAVCFHQTIRPNSYGQYWAWVRSALPGGQEVYVLGLAAICWTTWKAKNRTCFDKKSIKSPMDVLFSACVFLQYWIGLYAEGMWLLIKAGVKTLFSTATIIAKIEDRVARKRIGLMDMILEERNRRMDDEA